MCRFEENLQIIFDYLYFLPVFSGECEERGGQPPKGGERIQCVPLPLVPPLLPPLPGSCPLLAHPTTSAYLPVPAAALIPPPCMMLARPLWWWNRSVLVRPFDYKANPSTRTLVPAAGKGNWIWPLKW